MKRGAVTLALMTLLAPSANAQTLADAVERAWLRHPQASASSARQDEAEARAEIAAGVTPGPAAVSISSLNDRLNDNRGKQEWEVEMAVPLWLPGQKAAREREAESAMADVVARRTALRLQVAGEVRNAWWALAAARNGLDLARRREVTARALEADVRRRVAAGEIAQVDANLAQNERLAAEAGVLAERMTMLGAEQSYQRLIGSEAPAVLPVETVAPLSAPREDHPLLVAAAASARAAHERLRASEETRRDAPELAVRVVRDRGDSGESFANTVGVKLTVPFSSGARVRQKNSAARAEATQADAEMALAQQRLALDTEKSRFELDAAERQLAMAQERRDLTAANLRLAEKSFALGESDLVALLRSRASALEAEALLSRLQVTRAASISRLNQSLGVLP